MYEYRNRAINVRELRLMVKDKGREWTSQHISEALEKKQLKPEDFSIRDLARGLIDDGESWFSQMASPKGGFRSLTEAANAVDTSMFAGITGQIVYNKILEKYTNPKFLWQDLVETIPTTFLDGERFAGIGGVGDEFEITNETEPYPMLGVNEEFVDTPATVRRGGIVPVTKDIIIADRTGVLLERCSELGHYLGINKEKRVLDCVTGVTNTYKRNGTSSNTYATSGSVTNQVANPLVDWTDIENAELLLDGLTDPNTGEPMIAVPDTILVPSALKKTAQRILNATETATVDNQANAGTYRMWSPVPGPFYGETYTILSSPYVKARTSSASTWFLGNFKKAFAYMEAWKIETTTAGENSELAFTNDILMRYRAIERGTPAVKNPRFVTKNT